MKNAKGFLAVAGLIVGFILAVFGNPVGYGIIAGVAIAK